MNDVTITFQFDPVTWQPTAIFPNGRTNLETAILLELAEKMIEAIKGNRIDEIK